MFDLGHQRHRAVAVQPVPLRVPEQCRAVPAAPRAGAGREVGQQQDAAAGRPLHDRGRQRRTGRIEDGRQARRTAREPVDEIRPGRQLVGRERRREDVGVDRVQQRAGTVTTRTAPVTDRSGRHGGSPYPVGYPLGCAGSIDPGGGPAGVQPYQLVIDLGTCHTVAEVRRDGQAPRPLVFDGSPLLPSGVYRDPTGALAVGRDAERLSLLAPRNFEPDPKRCVDDGAVLLGDAPTPVVDMLAAPLRRVVAEASSDGTPRVVTLTCPADWGPQRREVLRAAARAAGLPQVRMVDEPVAAATY